MSMENTNHTFLLHLIILILTHQVINEVELVIRFVVWIDFAMLLLSHVIS